MESRKRSHENELNELFKKGKAFGLASLFKNHVVSECKTLVISNLDSSNTVEELQEMFQDCGNITDCSIHPSSSSSSDLPYVAEITYDTYDSACEALMDFDGFDMTNGNKLKIRLKDDPMSPSSFSDNNDSFLLPNDHQLSHLDSSQNIFGNVDSSSSTMEIHGVTSSFSASTSSCSSSSSFSNRIFQEACEMSKSTTRMDNGTFQDQNSFPYSPILSLQSPPPPLSMPPTSTFSSSLPSLSIETCMLPSSSPSSPRRQSLSAIVRSQHENFDFDFLKPSTELSISTNKKKKILSANQNISSVPAKVVDWFIKHGFNLKKVTQPVDFIDALLTPMAVACQKGDLYICDWLYLNGAAKDVRTVDTFSSCPMLIACEYGHVEICDWLYHHGAENDIFSENSEGFTPFTTCISSGKFELLNWLYEHGCDEESGVLTQPDRFGFTPLSHACYCGHLHFCQWLIHKKFRCKIQQQFKQLYQEQLTIASNKMMMEDKLLLSYDKLMTEDDEEEEDEYDIDRRLLNVCNNDGESPLMLACKSDNCFVVGKWLIELGANIHLVDTNGKTLLTWICQFNRLKFGQWFVGKFGSSLDLKHVDGTEFTPLKWACNRAQFCEEFDLIYWLLKCGALHTFTSTSSASTLTSHDGKEFRTIDKLRVLNDISPYHKVCHIILHKIHLETSMHFMFKSLILNSTTIIVKSKHHQIAQHMISNSNSNCPLNLLAQLDHLTGNFLRKEIADYVGISYGKEFNMICEVGLAITKLST